VKLPMAYDFRVKKRLGGRAMWALLVAGCLLQERAALADWPMARHDPKRTASSPGSSDITTPSISWRAYLGGHLGPTDLISFDIDGDGAQDLIYLEGGSLVVRKASGAQIWKTPLLNLTALYAVADFDGDKKFEVVASTSDHVMIFNGGTGAVLWTEPDGEMATLTGVRITDVNGDGKPDIIAKECGCCGVTKTGPWMYAHSFGGGFGAAAPTWSADPAGCGNFSFTVFDGDGDGKPELSSADDSVFNVLNGSTGQPLATTAAMGHLVHYSSCTPSNVDGVAGDELVCIQNVNLGASQGARRVFVLSYKSQPAPSVSVLWEHNVGDYDSGDLNAPTNLVSDLNGDGSLEVVVSGKDASDVWTTYVFDAHTGNQLTTIPNAKATSVAPIVSGKGALILTEDANTLSAWSYASTPMSAATLKWKLPNVEPVIFSDWQLGITSGTTTGLLSSDLNADGISDLLVKNADPTMRNTLTAYTASAAQPSMLGTYTFPDGVGPTSYWAFKGRAALLARNDGLVVTLDNSAHAVPASDGDGVRVGGYYSGSYSFGPTPVVGTTGAGAAQSIFAVDSRSALVRLDAADATMASPPKPSWSVLNTTTPVYVPQLAGTLPGLVCSQRKSAIDNEVVALRTDGSIVWTSPLANPQSFDVLPGKADADGIVDFFVQESVNSAVTTLALSGRTGATIWISPSVNLSWGLQPMAASDWDGDGRTDVLTVSNNLQVISGKTGTKLAEGPDFFGYFVPMIADVDSNSTEEVTLQGGFYPARTLQHDLTTPLWVGGEDDRPYPYGAFAACGGNQVLVESTLIHPARLKLTQASTGATTTLVLASGKKFADETAATSSKANLGQLGNVSVEANLTGKVHPSAVVGSTDGFLYAVNPCTGDLDFALDLGSPVGNPLFGDTDGDGKEEILVTAADGYLYGVKNQALPSPASVLDTDPAHGITDQDVDDITTIDSLSGKWTAVSGATSYEVAIVNATGDYQTTPPWKDVGNVLESTISGLALADGHSYKFAVRALANGTRSADTVSDGVTVHFPTADAGAEASADAQAEAADSGMSADAPAEAAPLDAGLDGSLDASSAEVPVAEGGGCDCSTSGRSSAPTRVLLALASMGLLMSARARRHKGASARHPSRESI
jgi:MYXO-CTERM domain-containing protein